MLVGTLVGLLIASALRSWVFGLYRVPSHSMAPLLQVGDVVWVDRLAYRRSAPAVGDVVVFEHPGPDGQLETMVKRVVAVGGERVLVEGRSLMVNGLPLERESLGEVELGRLGEPVAPRLFIERERWRERRSGVRWEVVERRTAPSLERFEQAVPAGELFVAGDHRSDSIDSRHAGFGTVPIGRVHGRVRAVVASYTPTQGWRGERLWLRLP
jgi:signal peptidase I